MKVLKDQQLERRVSVECGNQYGCVAQILPPIRCSSAAFTNQSSSIYQSVCSSALPNNQYVCSLAATTNLYECVAQLPPSINMCNWTAPNSPCVCSSAAPTK
jgi:hypothetical protein